MKKSTIYIITALIALFIIIPIVLNVTQDEKTKIMNKYETLTTTDHVFDQVTMSELDDMIATGDKLFVYFGSPICGACVQTVPHLNTMAKELGIETVYYVDFEYTSTLAGEWQETGKYDYKGTPSVVLFNNGGFVKSYQSPEYAQGETILAKLYSFLSDYA